ncbi:hypothetical protein E3N88_10808 [Mikania micrantha]|uniref:Uncharacterized protein n=1 Tax=Mikania micrantha TaxID=192012 RepID=A0A5N6PDX5_9ASTR|nr:hypothetical protein E3N88_10808 [Mikania micrantha]
MNEHALKKFEIEHGRLTIDRAGLSTRCQSGEYECTENVLVDALISALINKDEVASTSRSFLQANSEFDACEKMLHIWDSLKPSTHNILALASEVKKLQKDTEVLRSNLIKAEEEIITIKSQKGPDLYSTNAAANTAAKPDPTVATLFKLAALGEAVGEPVGVEAIDGGDVPGAPVGVPGVGGAGGDESGASLGGDVGTAGGGATTGDGGEAVGVADGETVGAAVGD